MRDSPYYGHWHTSRERLNSGQVPRPLPELHACCVRRVFCKARICLCIPSFSCPLGSTGIHLISQAGWNDVMSLSGPMSQGARIDFRLISGKIAHVELPFLCEFRDGKSLDVQSTMVIVISQ